MPKTLSPPPHSATVFSCCKSQSLQHMDSSFLTIFLNPLYTHAIVIIEKKIHVFLLIKQNQCYIFLLVLTKTQSFISLNIVYIIASGDYILLIRIFSFYISVLLDQLKLLVRGDLSNAGSSDIMVTIEIATAILGFFLSDVL